MGFWTLALGLGTALPAIITGFVELPNLDSDHPAQNTVLWHLSLTGSAVTVFLVGLLIRSSSIAPECARLVGAVACSVLGLGLLGAQLVYRHGGGASSSS